MSRPLTRLVSSAHVAAASSSSPCASSASTSTVSSSTARSRSSPMTRRPAQRRRPGEVVVAAGEVQAGGGQQRLHRLVLAEQQGLGLGEPALADAQVGEGDVGMPARPLASRPRTRPWPGRGRPRPRSSARARSAAWPARCRSGWRGRPAHLAAGPDQPVLAEQVGPRPGALEVGGEVAGGEERADRLGGRSSVSSAGPQASAIASSSSAMPSATRPACTWASPASASALVSRLTSPNRRARSSASSAAGEQLGRIVDVAAHRRHRHPALLDARRLVLDEPPRPREPGPAGGQVAQGVGEHLAELHARHRRPALLVRRGEASDRGRQVRDHGFDVEARPGLVGQLERPLRLVDAGHRASMAQGRGSSAGTASFRRLPRRS